MKIKSFPQKAVLIFSIVVIVGAVLALVLFRNSTDETTENSQTIESSPVEDISEWETHTNVNHDFTFKLPKSTMQIEKHGAFSATVFFNNQKSVDKNLQSRFAVLVDESKSIEAWLEDSTDSSRFTEYSRFQLNNHTAYRSDNLLTDTLLSNILVEKNGKTYLIELFSPENNPIEVKVLEEMLLTFEFTD